MHPYINIAIKAARRAGNIVIRSMNNPDRIQISEKGSKSDFVTNIDQIVEADIIDTISHAYPKHGIISEETADNKPAQEPVTWIIDPIDGTLNFIHGLPHFAISIAIECKGHIEHGVVFDPIKNELFTASRGCGATLNEKRIRVSNCSSLDYALLATGFSFKRTNTQEKETLQCFIELLKKSSDIRRTGSAALDLAYVASGRIDGYWEAGLYPWDVAAGSLIVRESGGFVGDYKGSEQFINNGYIVAGTRKIYHDLLEQLKIFDNP